jgi:hypothetical protein
MAVFSFKQLLEKIQTSRPGKVIDLAKRLCLRLHNAAAAIAARLRVTGGAHE